MCHAGIGTHTLLIRNQSLVILNLSATTRYRKQDFFVRVPFSTGKNLSGPYKNEVSGLLLLPSEVRLLN